MVHCMDYLVLASSDILLVLKEVERLKLVIDMPEEDIIEFVKEKFWSSFNGYVQVHRNQVIQEIQEEIRGEMARWKAQTRQELKEKITFPEFTDEECRKMVKESFQEYLKTYRVTDLVAWLKKREVTRMLQGPVTPQKVDD